MKILMTADTIGGVWTYAIELSRALASFGAQVTLATMGAPISAAQRRELQTVPRVEVFESRWRLEWMPNAWDDVNQAGDWLLGLERAVRPDVVHLNGFAHGSLPWSAPVLVVGHSCVRSWWEAVNGRARGVTLPSDWDRYTDRVREGVHAADAVVAPSHFMLDALRRHYGPRPLPSSRVILNGRSSALFSPGRKEPFIFAAGRLWDAAKNITALDAAAPLLAWPVYVAGDTAAPDGSDAAFPSRTSLRMLGRLDAPAIAGWMSRAAIYALPARYEPFGLSVVEAALSGCALVLGDLPSLREVWGDAATFVPPEDPSAIARAINWLCEDDGLRRAQAARARARALTLTPERMAREYDDVYAELRCGRSTGRPTERLACAS